MARGELNLEAGGQECNSNVATLASAAAASVPINAACTNGTDLRTILRIDCSYPADCQN
jgi:hypothetical protein